MRNSDLSRTTKNGFSRASSAESSSRMVSAPGRADCTWCARACNSVSPCVLSTSWMGTRIWPISPTCDTEPGPLRISSNILPAMYWRSAGEEIHCKKGRSCSRLSSVERFRRSLSEPPIRAIFAAAVRLTAARIKADVSSKRTRSSALPRASMGWRGFWARSTDVLRVTAIRFPCPILGLRCG